MTSYSGMTDEQVLSFLDKTTKLATSASNPTAIAAEKTRGIIVRECHKRNLIGYKSGRKFREAW